MKKLVKSSLVTPQVIDLLNSLPVIYEPREWVLAFRAALLKLLGDVDLISVDINLDCDIYAPESYSADLVTSEHMQTIGNRVSRRHISVMRKADRERGTHLLTQMKAGGFPFNKYHPPVTFEYRLAPKAYLATVLLFRERDQHTITPETLDLIRSLEPYFIFMFTDCIARQQRMDPMVRAFEDALQGLSDEHRLTANERELLILHLAGLTNREIAEQLGRSEKAIEKRWRSIFKKTGTNTGRELFASFFTPLHAIASTRQLPRRSTSKK